MSVSLLEVWGAQSRSVVWPSRDGYGGVKGTECQGGKASAVERMGEEGFCLGSGRKLMKAPGRGSRSGIREDEGLSRQGQQVQGI